MIKQSKYIYLCLLSYMFTAIINVAAAQTLNKGDIQFKPGSHSATLSGTVMRGDRDQYSLIASAGQWMEVKITALEKNAVFQLSIYSYGSGNDVPLQGAKEGDDASYWYGQLPSPGYSKNGKQNAVDMIIGGTRGNASYTLSVTITNKNTKAKKRAGILKPYSVKGKYQGLLQVLYCPSDKAQYGKYTDYGYWEGGAACGQQGQTGYWAWKNPNWYVWQHPSSQNLKEKIPQKAMGGTIKIMEMGGTSCYIRFVHEGKTYDEQAVFELCEQPQFINKHVRFSYTKQNLLAASCMGNLECKDSESIWIISYID